MARLDPGVPIKDTIRRAHAVHPISDLQIEYSLISGGPEAGIFPLLKQLGIGVTAYGVLSRGLLAGSKPTGPGDYRAGLPRFNGDNLLQKEKLVAVLQQLAASMRASASQVAIAWVMAQGRSFGLDMVPLVGSRTLKQLDESLGALQLALSAEDLQRIQAALPADAVTGTRYDAYQMTHLDSEK